MKTGFAAFLISLLVATLVTPLIRRWALRRNLVDAAGDGHRVHETPIPRLGGLAIAAAVFTPIAGLAVHQNLIGEGIYRDRRGLVTLFLGALGALGIGLVDDLYRPPARRRIMAMAVLAAFTWLGGHRIDVLDVPHIGVITFGALSLPITMLWIVGVMVAFNFIDGLDGLAAGIALIGTLTMFVVAARGEDVTWLTWTGAMAGALLGFLIFNFNPATIFMGDCGSNFLGFMIAVVAMSTSRKGKAATTLIIPFLAIGLPILDAGLTMVRRALLREGMFLSERGHLHHRLLDLGLSHKRVVLALYGVTVVLSLGALTLVLDVPFLQVAAALGIGAVVFTLMFATGYVRPDDLRLLYRAGLENRARQRALKELSNALSAELSALASRDDRFLVALERLTVEGKISGAAFHSRTGEELLIGDYDPTAPGVRWSLEIGSGGGSTVTFLWTGRTSGPSRSEERALAELMTAIARARPRPSHPTPHSA